MQKIKTRFSIPTRLQATLSVFNRYAPRKEESDVKI